MRIKKKIAHGRAKKMESKEKSLLVLANPFSRLTKTADFETKFSVLRAGVLQ